MQELEKTLRVQYELAEENERLYCALYDIAEAYGVRYDDGTLDIENLCNIVKKNASYGVVLCDGVWATAGSVVYDERLTEYTITSAQREYRHFGLRPNDVDDNYHGFFINLESTMHESYYGKKENVPISKESLHRYSRYMDQKTFIRYIDALKERGLL